jgi:hypothetical protein
MNVRDKSGHTVFSEGDVGAVHVMAHELLDSGRLDLGHERLGRWLIGRTGTGSDWAHIQFHMAVFELETGDWKSAYARFLEEIVPIAATSQDALTDAPALAWRLLLKGRTQEPLPWETLRRAALESLSRDPFVELHKLLALAGARDTVGIAAWLDANRADVPSRSDRIVVRMADALEACARNDDRRAAGLLKDVVPELPAIGGSAAQNGLFTELQARLEAA